MFVSPFDLTVSLWLTPVPEFETVVDPPVTPECGAEPSSGGDGSAPDAAPAAPGLETVIDDAIGGGTVNLPRTRLVFKGMQWVLVPVFASRVNPLYDQMTQLQRDQDEDRNEERARAAQRRSPAPPGANVDDASDPSTAAGPDATGPTQGSNDPRAVR